MGVISVLFCDHCHHAIESEKARAMYKNLEYCMSCRSDKFGVHEWTEKEMQTWRDSGTAERLLAVHMNAMGEARHRFKHLEGDPEMYNTLGVLIRETSLLATWQYALDYKKQSILEGVINSQKSLMNSTYGFTKAHGSVYGKGPSPESMGFKKVSPVKDNGVLPVLTKTDEGFGDN